MFFFSSCFAGLTVSEVTISSSSLLHTLQLHHFHQVKFFLFYICIHYMFPFKHNYNSC